MTKRNEIERLKKQIRNIGVPGVLKATVSILEETGSQDICNICLLVDVRRAIQGYEARASTPGE